MNVVVLFVLFLVDLLDTYVCIFIRNIWRKWRHDHVGEVDTTQDFPEIPILEMSNEILRNLRHFDVTRPKMLYFKRFISYNCYKIYYSKIIQRNLVYKSKRALSFFTFFSMIVSIANCHYHIVPSVH